MSHFQEILHGLRRLLTYPDQQTLPTCEFLFVLLQHDLPEAAEGIAAFGAFVDQQELSHVEQAYTRTFDVNPECALEVGWHLFGEEYARGMFLVRMREELRRFGLAESSELPDHLDHVLAIVASMSPDDARRFVRACVQPAVSRICAGVEKRDTPYRHVLVCLEQVLRQRWGPIDNDAPGPAVNTRGGVFATDPLQASYPRQSCERQLCASPSCDSRVALVQLTDTGEGRTTPQG